MITGSMKMADVVLLNHHLLPVVERFGIKLGFGNKTVSQICEHYRLNPALVLDVINTYHDKNFFPDKESREYSVEAIVQYLRKTHEYYINVELIKIEALIQELLDLNKEQSEHLVLIQNFFVEYAAELKEHIRVEENVVYPYVVKVEKAFLDKNTGSLPQEYSMETFMQEHDNVEKKLLDLKNIIIKYLPPIDNVDLSNRILYELFRLEKDLSDHTVLEEKTMVPKVIFMEESLNT